MIETANRVWLNMPGKAFLHFGALLGLGLMLMLNWPEAYRAFIYLNTLIVLAYMRPLWQDRSFRIVAGIVLAFPLVLTLLHMLAEGHPRFVKEIRHLWLVGFACLSILLLLRQHASTIRPYLATSLVWLLIVYSLAQATAWLIFHRPHGTTKNPHYLALYSSLAIPVALYLLLTMQRRLKLALIPVLALLGTFVLHTSSRPAWLALVITGLLSLLFLEGRKRLAAGLLILGIPLLLYFANIADFGDRATDLAVNIKKEERVVIWQDAWRMQQVSSPLQWFAGHGLDSYKEDFIHFSRWHGVMDFSSAHNSFMDILYTSGVAGLALCLWLYYWIYGSLWSLAKGSLEQRRLVLMLMSVTTINALFIGITIPFFAHYNTFTIAIIAGLLLYLKERSKHEA